LLLPYEALLETLSTLSIDVRAEQMQEKPVVKVPVCYGGDYGPDLAFVAQHNGLTPEEVVKRHSQGTYLVYMLGFLPGFAYMGGMDESIACPRLTSPRTRIPAGSVGIAGSQTGIYPLASPGGWQLIGRTPMKMFAMDGERAKFALSAGDLVQFVPITEDEYKAMEEQE
jgi:inhibitor of KinA